MNINFDCSTCSKHPENSIPIARILDKIDRLFRRNDLVEVGNVLDYWENEARRIHDDRALLEILNEKIGFYRRTADKEKGLASVNEAFALIEKLQIYGLESSGTVYLNGATTMKAFGKPREAIEYYEKARSIYLRTLTENDFRLAAFYNNISSA